MQCLQCSSTDYICIKDVSIITFNAFFRLLWRLI